VVNVLDYVVSKRQFLASGTFLKASLHHTAAMLVLTDLNTILHASIKNELSVLAGVVASRQVAISWMIGGFEDHQEGLNNVISMHVHCELHNIVIQCTDHLTQAFVAFSGSNEACCLISNYLVGQSVDQGLDSSGTVEVQ